MCNTYLINGIYCENTDQFRSVVGEEVFHRVWSKRHRPPPIDTHCLCGVDYDRMCEIYQETNDNFNDHGFVDYVFVNKGKPNANT